MEDKLIGVFILACGLPLFFTLGIAVLMWAFAAMNGQCLCHTYKDSPVQEHPGWYTSECKHCGHRWNVHD